MDESLDSKFQLLRTRIEADLPLPAVLLVTSAVAGDGKSVTARGLADCFARIGRRVALVDGNAATPHLPVKRHPASDGIRLLALPGDGTRGNVASRAMERFVDQMRGAYDCTVIDGSAFAEGNASVVLAGIVDGVLLTVRLGRVPREEDRLMCETLDHAKAPLIGVVAVAGEAIDAFNAPVLEPHFVEERRTVAETLERPVLTPRAVVR